MQNFFGLKLRLTVVFLVLGGFALTHLPQHQAVKEYNTFSNWVIQHLSVAYSDTDTEAQSDKPNSEHLRSLIQKTMLGAHTTGADECPDDKTRFLPHLYLAWTQHHDASDMAGTFAHERISIQLILKHFAVTLSGTLFSASGTETYPSFLRDSLHKQISAFPSFRLQAIISGQSVNAP
ncbi:hypothetical protein CYPRO_1184 [Cyclonatronum proteinivorum]|uniref:Uncharacterized protein n=1 Tax=Cyclonatronum proteinivorum TaxID=1457365 RepID=A0A345UIZ6_9BACT|nr:hypothetical protein [Cyclonatronum proteinivorum]AXJ00448.1 hypothetical protein CYPRO_1184 [Cyclonatronum proteinivorum]